MSSIQEKLNKVEPKNENSSFISYMSSFSTDQKSDLLNIIQYLVMSIVPVVLFLKLLKNYIPEENHNKSSIEILFEILLQVSSILVFIFLLDKIIRYFDTYSGVDYHPMNFVSFLLPFLIILFTLQTKLGAKCNILFDRCHELYTGQSKKQQQQPQNNLNNNSFKITQPGLQETSSSTTAIDSLPPPQPQVKQQASY